MELHIGGDLRADIQDLLDHGKAAPGQVGEGGGHHRCHGHHGRPGHHCHQGHQHLDRLVKEVAAAAFSSTIGDLRLVFQGDQQVVAE